MQNGRVSCDGCGCISRKSKTGAQVFDLASGDNSCSAESSAGEVARPHMLAHSFSCGALCKVTSLRSRSESVRAARKRGPFLPTGFGDPSSCGIRSEERRVGKE